MPTYEYECKKCFHLFEKFQYIKAKTLRKCPKCGARSLKRLIGSGSALIFKGSGFYITDYCRPKKPADESKKPEPKSDQTKKTKNSTEKDRQDSKKN